MGSTCQLPSLQLPAQQLCTSASIVDDVERQKNLDKAMLNALAKENIRCSMVAADAEPQMDLDKAGDYLKALMAGTVGLAHFVQVKDQPWTGT